MPTWAYYGNWSRLRSIGPSLDIGSICRGHEFALYRKLDDFGRCRRRRLHRAVHNFHGLGEVVRPFEAAHEIRQGRQRRAPPVDQNIVGGLPQLDQPHRVGQAAAHLVEEVHRAGLALPQLLDQGDALLQFGALIFELAHLLNHALQPRGFALRVGDLLVEIGRLVLQRPVPPADEQRRGDEDQAAADGDLLADLKLGFSLGAIAIDGKQVDFDQRSPARLNARPTATAAVGTIASRCSPEYFLGSSVTFRNGSNISTGVPNRSCSASANPSTREAPPLSMMRSMRSVDAVALKKSNVFCTSSSTFSVIARSTGTTSSKVAPSTG